MRQHDDTIRGYVRSVEDRPEVVVVGSVARGTPREDSDVDVYLVVADEAYAEARSRGRIAAVSQDGVTYPGGYVDIKLASPGYLKAAIARADRAPPAGRVFELFEHSVPLAARDRVVAARDRVVAALDEVNAGRRA